MKLAPILLLLLTLTRTLPAVRYPFINYRSSEGLPQSNVTAMLQDHDGFIWIGTQSGIGKFDGGSFEIFTSQDGLAGNYITDLEMGRSGDIWIASQDGLNKVHSGQITIWPLPETFVRDLAFSKSDMTLWVLAANSIYTIHDGVTARFNGFPDPGRLSGLSCSRSGMVFFSSDAVFLLKNGYVQGFSSPERINFVKETGKHLYVGCQGGLYILNPFGEFKKYSGLPESMNNIKDILFDVQGNLWIACKNGVFYKNLQTNETTIFNMASGLIYDDASKLLLDRENNILIGSEFGFSQLSRHLFRMYGREDGLPSTQVWNILENGGGILLACDDGIAELKEGRIRTFAINSQLRNRSIRVLVRMEKARFLLGCRDGEIFEWDGGTRLRSVTTGVNVLYAIRDSRGAAWFATDQGLLKYDGKDFRWFRDGLHDLIVWDIAELDQDTLLVGTRKGLQMFRGEKFVPSEWEDLVGKLTINDIHVVSPREVLLALERNGLIWLKGNTMTRLGQAQGMLHNDVWSVLRDDNGHIWMNTTSGLERFGTDGNFTHFNKGTGLFGDEGCIHAALKAHGGNLYFGIVPGLVEYTFFKVETPVRKPVLVIKNVRINGSPRKVPLAAPLLHNQNTIEFGFICPSTSRESPPVYKTRLFPFDSDWSVPNRATSVRYTNLPPATYTFSVLANNGGGESQWFGAANQVFFTIKSPFWKRWWFRALQFMLALGVIGLIVKIRVSVLEKQKKKLEEVVQARTNEIAEKNKELAYLSITDPLTDLKNRRYLEEKIKEDMSIIQRSLHDMRNGKKPFDEKSMSLGVFMLDVDRFKKVNDLYGHEAGDAVIREIGQQLQAMMRQSDTVVRWGGEEFLIITRQSSLGDAFHLAERVRLQIEQSVFKISHEHKIKKTLSIGFTHYPFLMGEEEKFTWHQIVALADNALYLAKHNGRNLVVGIKPGSVPFPGPGQDLLSDLAAAVKGNYMELISLKNNLKIPIHP